MQHRLGSFIDRWGAAQMTGWVDRGGGKHVTHAWEAAGGLVHLLEYGADYLSVQLRGDACASVGNDGIGELLGELATVQLEGKRVRASRVDFAWDGVPFKVATVRRAAAAGQMRSHSFRPDCTRYMQNAEGRTVYLQGKQGRKGERLMRVYDRRGPVRLELELKGGAAAGAVSKLAGGHVPVWPMLMKGMLRDVVDFVDRPKHVRHSARCVELPWWSEFLEGDEPVRKFGEIRAERGPVTELGAAEDMLRKNARRIEALRLAYGEAWFWSRVKHYAGRAWGPADEQRVADLGRYRGSGMAGLHERADEPPI